MSVPLAPGAQGKATSVRDVGLLLGAPARSLSLWSVPPPMREGSAGAMTAVGAGPGEPPLLPRSSQSTQTLLSASSPPSGSRSLGLSHRVPPGCPMGDKPLPGNKLCMAKGRTSLPTTRKVLPQLLRVGRRAGAACVSQQAHAEQGLGPKLCSCFPGLPPRGKRFPLHLLPLLPLQQTAPWSPPLVPGSTCSWPSTSTPCGLIG